LPVEKPIAISTRAETARVGFAEIVAIRMLE
jgi:hypothetical protein